MNKVGGAFDHVVGDIVLGGIGHMGYHLGKVPGVGSTGEYVRAHVAEGFHNAEKADKIRKTADNVARILAGGGNLSSETVAGMCRDAGIDAVDVDKVRSIAKEKAAKKRPDTGQIPAPASA